MKLRELRESLRRAKQRRGAAYPHQLAFLLEIPLRRLILSPGELADRLRLVPDSRVLEIGPGPGYFSVEVARRVPRGRHVLYDVQREMLAKARRKLSRRGVANAAFAQGDARWLPFCEGAFDAVFLVAVLGEVPDLDACIAEIHRVLRPGGLLSVTEQPGDPDLVPLEAIRVLAERHGFDFAETFGRGRNFTANFRRPQT